MFAYTLNRSFSRYYSTPRRNVPAVVWVNAQRETVFLSPRGDNCCCTAFVFKQYLATNGGWECVCQLYSMHGYVFQWNRNVNVKFNWFPFIKSSVDLIRWCATRVLLYNCHIKTGCLKSVFNFKRRKQWNEMKMNSLLLKEQKKHRFMHQSVEFIYLFHLFVKYNIIGIPKCHLTSWTFRELY